MQLLLPSSFLLLFGRAWKIMNIIFSAVYCHRTKGSVYASDWKYIINAFHKNAVTKVRVNENKIEFYYTYSVHSINKIESVYYIDTYRLDMSLKWMSQDVPLHSVMRNSTVRRTRLMTHLNCISFAIVWLWPINGMKSDGRTKITISLQFEKMKIIDCNAICAFPCAVYEYLNSNNGQQF